MLLTGLPYRECCQNHLLYNFVQKLQKDREKCPIIDPMQNHPGGIVMAKREAPSTKRSVSPFLDNHQPGRRHHAGEWNDKREIFTRLYVDENRTIKEIADLFQREYGFSAT